MTETILSNGYLFTFTSAVGHIPSGAENFGLVEDARQMLEALAGRGRTLKQLGRLCADHTGRLSVGRSWTDKLADLAVMLVRGQLAVAKTRQNNARHPGQNQADTAKSGPINCVTGEVLFNQTDFTLPGRLPLAWARSYGSSRKQWGVCGFGWQTPADARLEQDLNGLITFSDGAGTQVLFEQMPDQGPVTETAGGAVLDLNGAHLCVSLKSGLTYRFEAGAISSEACPVHSVHSRLGQGIRFERDRTGLGAIVFNDGRTIEVQSQDGRIARMSFQDRILAAYTYNGQGELVQVRDAADKPHTFAYESGRLCRHTNRTGLSFYYEYDDQGRCIHTFGDNGLHDRRLEYGHLRTTATTAPGHSMTCEYDDTLLSLRIKNALGHMTVYEYDAFSRPTAVTDPLRRRTEYSHDTHGNLICVTRSDGTTWRWCYDKNHNPVEVIDPAGRCHRYRYNEVGLLTAAVTPTGAITRYRYSPQGDLVAVTDPLGNTSCIDYDLLGQPVTVTDPLGRQSRFRYDALGNVAACIDPADRVTVFAYDSKSNLVQVRKPSGATLSFEYDAADRLCALTDELGNVTRIEYFGTGKPARRIDPDGATVTFHYDSQEQLIGLKDQNQRSFTLRRDPLGQVLSQTDYWGAVTCFAYDAAGRLILRTDAMGGTTTFIYDSLDRLIEKQYTGGIVENFAYDAAGNLVAHENDEMTVRRIFDRENRLIKEVQGNQAVIYAYDRAGRRIRRRSPHGNRIGYSYNAAGQIRTITLNNDTTITREYDQLSRPVHEILSNHITRGYTYDQDDRLTDLDLHLGERPGITRRFGYDAAGNLTRRSDYHGNDRFDYDPMARVIRHLNPEDRLRIYARNPAGELLRRAPNPAQSDHMHRRASLDGQTYTYDKNGHRVARRNRLGERLTYTWDPAGRLSAIQKPLFGGVFMAYDALGRRVCKDGLGAENDYLWDGDVILSDERNRKGAREYLFYPDSFVPLAVIDADKRIYYYHNDPNGAPTELSDATGKIIWAARYNATGGIDKCFVNQFDNPIRPKGQYEDRETGLRYNRHRYYAPGTGQFLSQDPLGLAAGENLYAFRPMHCLGGDRLKDTDQS